MPGVDVVVVSVDSTSGWTAAAGELVGSLRRAGASVVAAGTGAVPEVRTFALTDLVQARAARGVAERAIAEHDPAAVIYCSMTAALLWPRPGALWIDAVAAENRPGRHGLWQRTVERRRLAQAPLVLAMSPRALQALPDARRDFIVVPTPVSPSGPPSQARDIAALTYGANPEKRRLDLVLAAWARAKRPGETLVVGGLERYAPLPPGVELVGRMAPAEYRAMVRRTRVFVTAPRREDYGIAALEALADGCTLVTTPAQGAYPALDLARELDPRLVTDDLATALRVALDDPVPGYSGRAAELLEPFSRSAVDRTVSEAVLPRLLAALAPA